MKIKGSFLALMMVGALLIGAVGAFVVNGFIKNNDIGEITNYGSKNPRAIKTNITLERAKQIALEDAKAGNVTRAELDRENGIWVFEIEVMDGNMEKDYKINADTGEIINASIETDRNVIAQTSSDDSSKDMSNKSANNRSENTSSNVSNTKIGLDRAKEIALKEAKSGNVTKAELDRENGILVYDIEVVDGSIEKDYRIDANTGAVLKTEIETRRTAQSTKNQNTSNNTLNNTSNNALNNTSTNTSNNTSTNASNNTSDHSSGNTANAKISLDKAKQIALESAKKGQITKIELDRENGVLVYEVEIRDGNVEKDYKINAQSGAVVESKVDNHDNDDYYDHPLDDDDDDDDDFDGDND